MPLPPEIIEQRSDEREVFALINALRRQSADIGGGAPVDASYWVSTADATLTAEVDMGALTSGILRQTVAAGVATPGIVTVGAGLTYASPTLDRAALTGDITASAGSNTTAFRSFAARSVLANATAGAAIPTELSSGTDGFVLRQSGTTLSFGTLGASSIPALDATFWTSTSNANLANEINLGALGDGTLQHTVTLGVSTPTAFAGTTGRIPYYIANSQLSEHASLSFNAAGGHLLLGNDLYFTRAGASSIEKQGSGTMYIGSSVGDLFLYTGGGTNSLIMDSAGKVTIGSSTGLTFDPATNQLLIGTVLPFAGALIEGVKSNNGATAFTIANPSAGGSAYAAFFLAQSSNLVTGATFGTFLFSSGSTFGLPYGPNIGLFELAGGAGNMHFWIQQNAGDFVWYTKPTFPSTNERMRLTTAGVLSVNDLGSAGTGRLVKAAVTTGILSIASAGDVAEAITWPADNRILISTGTTTAPEGLAGFEYDAGDNQLWLSASHEQAWYNLGGPTDANYERVRSFWTGNVWNLKSEEAGTGTVRNMTIDADTAALSLLGDGGVTLTSSTSSFVIASGQAVTAQQISNSANYMTVQDTHVGFGASPTVSSAAAAVADVIRLEPDVTVSGSNTIADPFCGVTVRAFQINSASADVTNAATMRIEGDATISGGAALGSGYSLWVAGRTRQVGEFISLADTLLGGSGSNIGFFGGAGATQQTSGANLTNNVTSGGTSDQIDNWTDLTTYATDAAAIRNAVYQLARKVKQLNDGSRAYNLFT